MTEAEPAVASWSRCFPTTPPVGYILRVAFPTRHVRRHYFDDSTRTPSGPTQERSVAALLKATIADALGRASKLQAFLYSFEESIDAVALRLQLDPVKDLPSEWTKQLDDYVDVEALRMFEGPFSFTSDTWDLALLGVAKDEIAGATIWSPGGCKAVCPYDGGVDMIMAGEAEADALREKFGAHGL